MLKKTLFFSLLATSSLSFGMESFKKEMKKMHFDRKALNCTNLTHLLHETAVKEGKSNSVEDKIYWGVHALSTKLLLDIKCNQDSELYGRMDIYDDFGNNLDD